MTLQSSRHLWRTLRVAGMAIDTQFSITRIRFDESYAVQSTAGVACLQLPCHVFQTSSFTTVSRIKQQDPQESFSATELAGLAAKLAESSHGPGGSAITGHGPRLAYTEGRDEGLIRPDPKQEITVEKLQQLYEDLLEAYPAPSKRKIGSGLTLIDAASPNNQDKIINKPWWKTLFASSRTEIDATGENGDDDRVQGLYMFGGVGCGKTMLMDLFAACAPPQFKLLRTHFHDFMLDIHTRLRAHQSTPDPLSAVASEVAASTHVLCLDEFFVTDVADAMILHRLFDKLWDYGLVLVATSNRHPDSLYEGGLQRALFLPFIHRLKEACAIHNMDSPTDYRRLAHHRDGLYFTSPSREKELEERFIELTNRKKVGPKIIEVAMGRQLVIPRAGGCIALFTFEELCNRPLGAADFIALADAQHTVAISGIPVFNAANRTAGYRFVTLVDVLYEHRVRLLCSAEAMPLQLFENIMTNHDYKDAMMGSASMSPTAKINGEIVVDDNLGFAKDRTVSRLTEMQSKEYLRAHAERHAPELLYALEEAEKRKEGRHK